MSQPADPTNSQDNDQTVTAAEAKKRFAEMLRVTERGGVVEVTRYGRPVATLVAADRWAQRNAIGEDDWLASLLGPFEDVSEVAEAVGTVSPPGSLEARARRHASAQGLSLAEFVRACLAQGLRTASENRRATDPLFASPVWEGDTPENLAADHDHYLYDEPET